MTDKTAEDVGMDTAHDLEMTLDAFADLITTGAITLTRDDAWKVQAAIIRVLPMLSAIISPAPPTTPQQTPSVSYDNAPPDDDSRRMR